jgi:membrane fusion protein, multidrug efflux system
MKTFSMANDEPGRGSVSGLAVCSAALLLLVTLAACGRNQAAAEKGVGASERESRVVKIATVTEQVMERAVSVIGSLAAHDEATLSVKVPGRLQTIAVDLGSVVRKGQLIAQVEPEDYELQLRQSEALLSQTRARLGLPLNGDIDTVDLEQASTVKEAKARLEEARKNRDRIVELTQQGILSKSDQETADAAYEVAANRYRDAVEEINNRRAQLAQRRAEVEIARKQLADTAIRAPFDGAVQERRASPGEYLIAGTPVVTIVRTDPLRLRVEAPEREAPAVHTGQTVRVRVEGDAAAHTGRISRVSPAIDRQSRMLMVEADIPNDGSLRPGSFVSADIVTRDDGKSLSVPSNAIVTFAGIEKVFVVENGKALEKQIATGRRGTNWVEIVSGLKAGDTVVLDPGNLQTGDAVKAESPPAENPAASSRS